MDSKFSIEYLDKLEPLGFDDDAFAELHPTGLGIRSFRRYAGQTPDFIGHTNCFVTIRLGKVLNAYLAGGFQNPEVFKLLAQAAWLDAQPVQQVA
jgi:hypothetical protein